MKHLRYSCVSFLLSLSAVLLNAQNLAWVSKEGARKIPSSKNQYWVNDYGAANDGSKLSTEAIQKAIDACAAKGGGIVSFKPGTYIMGSIFLKTNVHLVIDKDVLIKGSQDF